MRCLFLFLFLATVQGENPLIREMDEHRCLGSVWVTDGWRNRYISQRKSSIVPAKTMIDNLWVYAYSHTFREGQTLQIFAHIRFPYYGGEFSVNLMSGTPITRDGSGATVLHLKFVMPRPSIMPGGMQIAQVDSTSGTLTVIGNTHKNGEWMSEIKGSSFAVEKNLSLAVTALADKFEIRANGEVLLEYPYRMSLDHVHFINGFGTGLNLNLIYIGGQVVRAPRRNVFPDGGLKPGDNLIVYGLSNDNFSVSFTNPEKKADILLDMKVNFNRQTVIFNSKINQKWNEAVHAPYFPFKTGKAFELEMRFFERILTVYVDKVELATFDHRAIPIYPEMNLHYTLEVREVTVCKSQK